MPAKKRMVPYQREVREIIQELNLQRSHGFLLFLIVSYLKVNSKDPVCFASQSTLADIMGVSRQHVTKVIRDLKNLNLIKIGKHKLKEKHGSNYLNEYRVIYPWQSMAGDACSCHLKGEQVTHENQAGDACRLQAGDACRLPKNNIRKRKQKKNKTTEKVPPPPPSGASGSNEEDSPNSFSKTNSPVEKGSGQNVSHIDPLPRKERLAKLKAEMKAIKGNTPFAKLPIDKRRHFVSLAIEFRTIKDQNKDYASELEAFADEALRKRQLTQSKPILHVEAWTLTLKYNCLAGRQPDFELWRESNKSFYDD